MSQKPPPPPCAQCTGTLSEESAPHQVGQDAIEAFLREDGLTSLSLSPLPLRRLSSSDRRDILGKRWLSDDVIDLAQEVLQRQFPHIGVLYACGAAFILLPLQPGTKSVFVQVVNRSAPQSCVHGRLQPCVGFSLAAAVILWRHTQQ